MLYNGGGIGPEDEFCVRRRWNLLYNGGGMGRTTAVELGVRGRWNGAYDRGGIGRTRELSSFRERWVQACGWAGFPKCSITPEMRRREEKQ